MTTEAEWRARIEECRPVNGVTYEYTFRRIAELQLDLAAEMVKRIVEFDKARGEVAAEVGK